jgi:hypothetical protein
MQRKAIDLLMIAMVFLAFIAGCNWNKPEPCNPQLIPGDTTVVVKYVYRSDTIPKPKPKKTYPVPPPPNYPSAGIDTAGDAIVEALNDSIREYELYNGDSSVKVNSTVAGLLLNQVITARTTERTLTVHDTIVRPPKWALYVGLSLGYNHIAPTAILCRNKAYLMAGWDMIGRMPVVGYGIRIAKAKD